MKKGKVEWLYKIAALMPDGKLGIDMITTVKKFTKQDVQEFAEALETNVHVEYLGTIIKPPESEKNNMSYDFLTEEEKQIRLAFAKKQEKEAQNANSNENTLQ